MEGQKVATIEYFNFKSWWAHLGLTVDFWRNQSFADHLKHSIEDNSWLGLAHKVTRCQAY